MKNNERPIECQATLARINSHCSKREKEQVLEHIKTCDSCRKQYEEAEEMDALFEQSIEDVPSELHEYIMEGVRREQQKKSFLENVFQFLSQKRHVAFVAAAAIFCFAFISMPMMFYHINSSQNEMEQEQIRMLNERIAQLENEIISVLENHEGVSTDKIAALTDQLTGAATTDQVDSLVEALEKVITAVEKERQRQSSASDSLFPMHYEGMDESIAAYLFFYNGRIRIIIGDNIYVCQGIQKGDKLILTEENHGFSISLIRNIDDSGNMYYLIDSEIPFTSTGARIK